MPRYFALFTLIISASLNACAQGVPKAYEAFNYQGKVNGKLVSFSLADGYIGASNLKMYWPGKVKPVVFQPESGAADGHHLLKFAPFMQRKAGYFILNNMQEAYEDIPAYIMGKYFLAGKKISVKFRLIKQH